MGRVIHIAIAGAIAAVSALALMTVAQAERAQVNPFAYDLLAAHNAERDALGLPRLAWSGKLAGEAQSWAEHIARQGQMVHASRDQRRGAGENLWMGAAGYYGAEVMVGGFLSERPHYHHDIFPNVSRTGNWRDVGHYTQIIWRDTKEVGCAVARGTREDFLVCRYWPAGNIYGRMAY